jgi:hypothetical protein
MLVLLNANGEMTHQHDVLSIKQSEFLSKLTCLTAVKGCFSAVPAMWDLSYPRSTRIHTAYQKPLVIP